MDNKTNILKEEITYDSLDLPPEALTTKDNIHLVMTRAISGSEYMICTFENAYSGNISNALIHIGGS